MLILKSSMVTLASKFTDSCKKITDDEKTNKNIMCDIMFY